MVGGFSAAQAAITNGVNPGTKSYTLADGFVVDPSTPFQPITGGNYNSDSTTTTTTKAEKVTSTFCLIWRW